MRAIVVCDPYDDKDHHTDLIDELRAGGFRTLTVSHLSEVNKHHGGSEFSKLPCLLYRSPSVRISEPLMLFQWLDVNPEFPYVASHTGEIIAVNFSTLKLLEDGSFPSFQNKAPFLSNIATHRKEIEADRPVIFMYTSGRPKYFELAFDSLVYSLNDEKYEMYVMITITDDKIVNNIKNIVKDRATILTCKEATSYSAVNLFYQFRKPETMVIYEDDFILPDSTRHFYPNWPMEFSKLLDNYDVIAWGHTLCNAPTSYNDIIKTDNGSMLKHPYQNRNLFTNRHRYIPSYSENKVLFGGHSMAFKGKYFEKIAKYKQNKCPFDEDLISAAARTLSPQLLGYHIGFNIEQNNYGSYKNGTRWVHVPKHNEITDHTTQVTKCINVEDIGLPE